MKVYRMKPGEVRAKEMLTRLANADQALLRQMVESKLDISGLTNPRRPAYVLDLLAWHFARAEEQELNGALRRVLEPGMARSRVWGDQGLLRQDALWFCRELEQVLRLIWRYRFTEAHYRLLPVGAEHDVNAPMWVVSTFPEGEGWALTCCKEGGGHLYLLVQADGFRRNYRDMARQMREFLQTEEVIWLAEE